MVIIDPALFHILGESRVSVFGHLARTPTFNHVPAGQLERSDNHGRRRQCGPVRQQQGGLGTFCPLGASDR